MAEPLERTTTNFITAYAANLRRILADLTDADFAELNAWLRQRDGTANMAKATTTDLIEAVLAFTVANNRHEDAHVVGQSLRMMQGLPFDIEAGGVSFMGAGSRPTLVPRFSPPQGDSE